MTELVLMPRKALAAEVRSAEIKLPNGYLADLLPSRVPINYLQKNPVTWTDSQDKGLMLRALAKKPVAQIKSFGLDKIEQHFVLPLKKDGTLLFLSADDDDIRILSPVASIDVFAAFAELLRPTEAAPALDVEWELSQEALMALFAIIDRFRFMMSASLVARTGLDALVFDNAALHEQLKTGAKTQDYRWLCAYLPLLYPEAQTLTKVRLIAACDQLAKKDLLLKVGSKSSPAFIPSNALVNVAYQFLNPLPSVLFHRAASRGSPTGEIVMVLSGQTFWRLKCNKRKSFLSCIEGLQVIEVLHRELGTVLSEPSERVADATRPSESAEPVPTPAPDATGDEVSEAAEPEKEAMSAKPTHGAKAKFCTNCGSNLKLGVRFCTACGTQFEDRVT